MLFGTRVLRGAYLRRGGQVKDFISATQHLELALVWLDRNPQNGNPQNDIIVDRLIRWMVLLCLQQFRVDCLQNVRSSIREDARDDALLGDRPFPAAYLDDILINGLYCISGNKTAFKTPRHLANFLFKHRDGKIRNHWEHLPFRKLYQRARTALRMRTEEYLFDFDHFFWRFFYAYHWVLPYPHRDGLTQTDKAQQRMWYSIDCPAPPPRGARSLFNVDPSMWFWARKAWKGGEPPPIPDYVAWSREQWEAWLEREHGQH